MRETWMLLRGFTVSTFPLLRRLLQQPAQDMKSSKPGELESQFTPRRYFSAHLMSWEADTSPAWKRKKKPVLLDGKWWNMMQRVWSHLCSVNMMVGFRVRSGFLFWCYCVPLIKYKEEERNGTKCLWPKVSTVYCNFIKVYLYNGRGINYCNLRVVLIFCVIIRTNIDGNIMHQKLICFYKHLQPGYVQTMLQP